MVDEEGVNAPVPLDQDPSVAGARAESYWSRRSGNHPQATGAGAPSSPSSPSPTTTLADARHSSGPAAPSGETAPPGALGFAPMAPPVESPRPKRRPVVMYGPYRAHDPVKNWIIGSVAIVVLIAATLVTGLVAAQSVRGSLISATALPSTGPNTVAWYWSSEFGGSSPVARPLGVANSDLTTTVASVQDSEFAYFVALDRNGNAWMWGQALQPQDWLPVTQQPAMVTMPPGVRFTDLATGNGYVLALDQSGHIWSWGHDIVVTPTTTTTTPSSSARPTEIATPSGVTFKALSVGLDYASGAGLDRPHLGLGQQQRGESRTRDTCDAGGRSRRGGDVPRRPLHGHLGRDLPERRGGLDRTRAGRGVTTRAAISE